MNLILPILAALAMSVGWGFRGDYGHEAGAMAPGALVALAICLSARRPDWWERASLLALLGAIGWAFGGQMSYGVVIGYTAHSSFWNVLYGFACLFVIGALWGGIGSGILALGVTRSRAELERFAGPLIVLWLVWMATEWSGLDDRLSSRWSLYDSDWTAASWALIVALAVGLLRPASRSACRLMGELAAGWWAGLLVLTVLLKLRMTPPRSDNWAGCVGLWIALFVHLLRTRNRAAMMLSLYGLLAGGIGFAVGDLFNMLGRAQWGPIGRFESLQRLDSWKWMEQLFGLMMGFGVALGFARIARRLPPPIEDEPAGPLRYVSLLFLFLAIWWQNLPRNVAVWVREGNLFDWVLGLPPQRWMLIVALLLSAIIAWAIVRHRREGLPMVPSHAFGRAQLLFLLILWTALVADFTRAFPAMKTRAVFFVHLTFWLTALACTLIALALPASGGTAVSDTLSADDPRWRPGWKHALLWALVPALIFALARAAVASHQGPLPGSHLRFEAPE